MKHVNISETMKAHFCEMIEKQARKHRVLGISYAIVQEQETLFAHHYGVVTADQRKNDARQKMMIGSNTKLLTAIAIMQLHERGRLAIDDPVEKYLPNLKIQAHQRTEPMTIRDVLMHMSGLPSDDYALITDASATLNDLLDRLKNHHRVAPAQTMPAYSNLGYGLLGLIIEAVSNMSYEHYLQTTINAVLSTTFQILETNEKRVRYQETISQSFDKKGQRVEDPLSVLISAGSNTYATLEDLIRLMKALIQPDRQRLLSEAVMQQILTPPSPLHEGVMHERTGLGMRHDYLNAYHRDVGPVMGHGGNTTYHHSTFDIFSKHRLGVIAMSNSERGMAAISKINTVIMVELFKAMGIHLPKTPAPVYLERFTDPFRFAKAYVATGLKVNFKQKKNRLPVAKFLFFKCTLKRCEDGFYQLFPRGLTRFPLLSKMIHQIRIRPAYRANRQFLYIEQNNPYYRITLPFASAYKTSDIPPAWRLALGHYNQVALDASGEPLVNDVRLKSKKACLMLSFKTMNSRVHLYLHVLNDTEARVQGYGRMAGDTCYLTSHAGRFVLRFYGIEASRAMPTH